MLQSLLVFPYHEDDAIKFVVLARVIKFPNIMRDVLKFS